MSDKVFESFNNLQMLTNLESVGFGISIENNQNLSDLSHLSNLTSVGEGGIELISNGVVATTLTSGWTVNAAGNQITIPAATAQLNSWTVSGGVANRTVRLTTAADQTATTPAIGTEP